MPAVSGRFTHTQAARALGVSPKTLYTWEKQGKITAPERNERGWRFYTPEQMTTMRDLLAQEGKAARSRPSTWIIGGHSGLKVSACSVIWGTVTNMSMDGMSAEIVLTLGDEQQITSIISRHSAEALGLSVGKRACVVIRPTDLMVGVNERPDLK